MSFRRAVTVIAVLAAVQCSVLAECDITKCNIPKHYREIGCKPTKFAEDDADKCCPIEYDCGEIMAQDRTQCHFRGRAYNEGELMTEQEANCRAQCRCTEGTFRCAHIECPELVFNRPEPHCVVQNTRSKCCSENIICDKEKIEELPVCWMDDQMYRLGQTMHPKNERCFTCICDEKFDNSTAISKNSACSEVDCAIDLSRLSKIRDGCVPVYYGEATCCPIDTKCPKADDKPVPALSRNAANPELKCKFGDHELQIGDKVSDSNKCVDCECAIPPMITCVQKRNC